MRSAGASPDPQTQLALERQLLDLRHGEYVDADPGRWLTWHGRGMYGPQRYACGEHRGELKALLREHYGTLGWHPWAIGTASLGGAPRDRPGAALGSLAALDARRAGRRRAGSAAIADQLASRLASPQSAHSPTSAKWVKRTSYPKRSLSPLAQRIELLGGHRRHLRRSASQ